MNTAAKPAATAYDEVPYPTQHHAQTHPDRLATIATLYGMNPAPVTACRVLELGTGDGGNLFPPAYALPGSEFVGVDLAERAIDRGRARVRALGLRNLRLEQMDLTDLPADLGSFDYIVAHGVYSWVPAFVRERILQICKRHLSPRGVAFVSYNALPGGHVRRLVRDAMRFHLDHTAGAARADMTPVRQVDEVRRLLAALSTPPAGQEPDAYRMLIAKESQRVHAVPDGVVFHDDLSRENNPFYFHQFARDAAAHELQYLAEAEFSETQHEPPGGPELAALMAQPGTASSSSASSSSSSSSSAAASAAAAAASTTTEAEPVRGAGDDVLLREQYGDFVKCRMFRQTLLCHASVPLRRPVAPSRIAGLFVGSAAKPAGPVGDVRSQDPVRFETSAGARVTAGHPLIKAALLSLAEASPRLLPFAELLDAARARAGTPAPPPGGDPFADEDTAGLAETILRLYATRVVELRVHPLSFCTAPGPRPAANPVARLQAAEGPVVSLLRGGSVRLDDPLARHLLLLLDGTRDRRQLPDAVAPFLPGGARPTDEAVDACIAALAELSLMVS